MGSVAGERSYLSVSEAATLLGVNRVSVWRWIRAGYVPASRVGQRTTRIKRADLDRLLRGGHESAGGQGAGVGSQPEAARESGEHFVQFYESDAHLVHRLTDYIGGALKAGEVGIVVATPSHRRALERNLRLMGLKLPELRAKQRYMALDAAQALGRFVSNDMPDQELFLASIGRIIERTTRGKPAVRVFGEMVALLALDGSDEGALRLEQFWNGLRQKYQFTLFCAYPMDGLGGANKTALHDGVCDTHTRVIPAESYTRLESEEERARAISGLQQRAQSLEAEVAERKRAEARLQHALASERDAREAAERALRLRDEFLSVASHELRTPVASLSLQAQTMLRRLERDGAIEPERAVHALQTITGQAGKLSRLLNQLLDVSRLEAGKVGLERQRVDLRLLLDEVLDAARALSGGRCFVLTAPRSLYAEVDALRLEQVLTNLIDNAVKFSPDGGAIDVTLASPASGCFELAVRDRGVGIPPTARARIFQRFFQAHGDRHGGGMGLGLYVSQQIVAMHGGHIKAEFPADGGTRFVLQLPTCA